MHRKLFFSLLLLFGLGLSVSSCAPGVYAGASIGAPYPYYGPRYGYGYGSGYYARPIIVAPRPVIVTPAYRGGFHGDGGFRGGRGFGGGGGFRRGGR